MLFLALCKQGSGDSEEYFAQGHSYSLVGQDLNLHLCISKACVFLSPVLSLDQPLLPRVKQLTRAEVKTLTEVL